MGDILDEAAALVQCKECPWYRSCVVPLRFSAEDLRRQMQSAIPGAFSPESGLGMPQFLANLASAAQHSLLEGCPIFIERLRSSPRLAERIKKLMQTWGMESDDAEPKK
ncbi:MAG: hypothetical protein M1136_00185 [Chloroflexi bacterium]|nr:hypothetical protein [Chloroflexota bacterium]MCL5074057.1 hypothetical protein [Chloroflexota bacterium]